MLRSGSVGSRRRGLRSAVTAAVVVAGVLWGAGPVMAEEIQFCRDKMPGGGGLTMGPGDGKVWITEGNGLSRIDLDCTNHQHFPLPSDGTSDVQGAGLRDVTSGSDGNLWFTSFINGRPFIGKMTPQGEFTEYPMAEFTAQRSDLPTTGAGFPVDMVAYEVEAGPDGKIWFTAQDYVANYTGVRSYQRQSYIGRASHLRTRSGR